MGVPRHGINGLIYISGTELTGANAWAVNIANDAEEAIQFGGRWKKQLVGGRGWSGSINAYDHSDSKIIANAATAGQSVALLIYPTREDLSDYYSGNAVFGMASGGSTTSSVSRDGDFVGDDTLTITGWT